jgi:putative ABC transport system permease protein
MGAYATEFRTALRGLARTPTVTLAATLCLALGIGATTAISSAISRALVQPLPFEDGDRLVALHRTTPQSGPQGTWPESPANYYDFARRTRQIEGLAAVMWGGALVNLPSGAMQSSRLDVSGNFFATIRVTPERGRLIGPNDDRLDTPLVAVLSDEFWRATLGGNDSVVGRSLMIDGAPTTIIGILPADFRVPHGGNLLRADVWMPIRFKPERAAQRNNNFLQVIGRLAPNATVESADLEARKIFADLAVSYDNIRGENVRVAPLRSENLQSIRKPLLLLFGAVCMVLMIAATNVAAMLLARGVHRRRDMAVRAALGASAWDTARPVLMESATIAGFGALGGLAIAYVGTKTIGALAAARMQQLVGLRMDIPVLVFALALSGLVALVCGAVPAWRSASVDPQDALRGGRGGGTGGEHHRALAGLVVLEISLSLTLLIGAGLVLKGFASLLKNDPGFETRHVLVARVTGSPLRYPNQSGVRDLVEPVVRSIESVPGVEAVGAINLPPYVNWGSNSNVRYEGQRGDNITRLPLVEERTVSPGYFGVTKQRLIVGRLLNANDDERPAAAQVVVVNVALMRRDFHGQNPVGRRFYTGDTTFATIVGVVTDVRNSGPINAPQPEMYWTYRQNLPSASSFSLMVRTQSADPTAVTAGLRAAVRGVDPTAAIADLRPMPDVIAATLGRPNFYLSLLGSFAVIALLLAMAGLYGVMSYAVAQRTREIGIRAALGSSRARLIRLIGSEGLRLVGGGIVLGLLGGAGVTRLMVSMLFGVSPLDPTIWALSAVLILLAGAMASVVPARRAARVDPAIAMRAE